MVDYYATQEAACQHLERTNVMTDIPRVPREDAPYQNKEKESREKRVVWRPEEKNVSWEKNVSCEKNLIGELTRREDFVKSFWISTCSTSKACMLLDQHRMFFGCHLDSDVSSTAEPDLLSYLFRKV